MLEIRKAFPTDAYTLIKINDIVWKKEFYDIFPNGIFTKMQEDLNKRINHLRDQIQENNRIFVALEDEEPIGYIFYAKAQNTIYSLSAEIRAIYILPEHQRKGIGTKLFQKALEEIKKLGYNSLIINSPIESPCLNFFIKMGGEQKEIIFKNISGYPLQFDLIYYDLNSLNKENYNYKDWNEIYSTAQEYLYLLNDINKELAIIMTNNGHMYLGLGIKNRVCPIESALSNMYIGQETYVSKILILNRQSKPVLPCGKCRDLLIGLGQEKAEILFDLGTLKTMSMKELNPYYKDEEKV